MLAVQQEKKKKEIKKTTGSGPVPSVINSRIGFSFSANTEGMYELYTIIYFHTFLIMFNMYTYIFTQTKN
jgi:hypothetical protein